jgi:hypothetical protein
MHVGAQGEHLLADAERSARFAHREHPSRAIVNASIGAT